MVKHIVLTAIKETERDLAKARKVYAETVEALKMEVADNEEFGNPKSANKDWVDYCLKDLKRVKFLESHLAKLQEAVA